jgi:lipoyl(octanoyl) transferase
MIYLILLFMQKQKIFFHDLGLMGYQEAWDFQEKLLKENVAVKSALRNLAPGTSNLSEEVKIAEQHSTFPTESAILTHTLPTTRNYLLFVEHPPVYTLGKSGNMENVLLTSEQLAEKNILFYHTNRGGDITFHGPGQVVGYPILDLEKFDTDIGKYLRRIEDVIILTLAGYGILAERSPGETGVWIDATIPGKARKICAIGVRCSRWITMHGFALNVNTDLSYFNYIIPCGISNKQVTSLQKELGRTLDMEEVKENLKRNFEEVFNIIITTDTASA